MSNTHEGKGWPLASFKISAGNVEKSRQRRSRHFAVLTYSMYPPRVKRAAALLDGLFWTFPSWMWMVVGRGEKMVIPAWLWTVGLDTVAFPWDCDLYRFRFVISSWRTWKESELCGFLSHDYGALFFSFWLWRFYRGAWGFHPDSLPQKFIFQFKG